MRQVDAGLDSLGLVEDISGMTKIDMYRAVHSFSTFVAPCLLYPGTYLRSTNVAGNEYYNNLHDPFFITAYETNHYRFFSRARYSLTPGICGGGGDCVIRRGTSD